MDCEEVWKCGPDKVERIKTAKNISSILPKLKCEVLQREESFKEGIVYSNGFVSSKVWDNLERFNHVCKEEYGIELF